MKTLTTTPQSPAPSIAPQSGNKEAAQAAATIHRMVERVLPKVSSFATKKERLNYVADMIESQALAEKKIGFNMNWWRLDRSEERATELNRFGTKCGTVACIAGWTSLLENGTESLVFGSSTAKGVLMLTHGEAAELFTPSEAMVSRTISDITPEKAVSVIRHLADHGEVRWDLYDSTGQRRT